MTNTAEGGSHGPSTTLRQAQSLVDGWIKAHGVRYFGELTNLALLMEEVGELARLFARHFGEQSFKPGEEKADLGDKMSDILWILLCLANQTGVDLDSAFQNNLRKKTERDAQRHLNNPKLRKK